METKQKHALSDAAARNIRWSLEQWGDREAWIHGHKYGSRWQGDRQRQMMGRMAQISEQYLLPHLGGRRDLVVLELAPGAGRFTTELIRTARELWLVDLNATCIELCKERFKYYEEIRYFVNDGASLDMIPEASFELIASYDSLVHVDPEIIRAYLGQFFSKLVPGGIAWVDHSGRGVQEAGSRSAMSFELMHRFAQEIGFEVRAQHWRNGHDCISVLIKPPRAGAAGR